MSNSAIEQLIDPQFVNGLPSLGLDEVRRRRGACHNAEEALSLHRRLVQGRLDIVQAELYRRAGGVGAQDLASLVESLPDILVEHGDRHLGPGRLTSVDLGAQQFGANFDELITQLDHIVGGAKLSSLGEVQEQELRTITDQLDELERSISVQRHQLHHHIDLLQEEIVRRYKTGEASVDGLLSP